jgi:ATP-dependent DNA helicase RecQ
MERSTAFAASIVLPSNLSGELTMPVATARRTSSPLDQAHDKLAEVFGFDTFRPGQQQVITHLLSGQSAVAIFPTGSGKSLCYQLPALLIDGLTVVISPLIALMKDQIDFLQARNIPAARLDSSLSRDEILQAYSDLRAKRTRILFVSPERLGNERFLQLLEHQQIGLLAVDEAHCISEWGHNFRPDYLRIAALAERLKVERVLALTATATPDVVNDIAKGFHVPPRNVVQTGFYRPNLELRVTACTERQRKQLIIERLAARPAGPAIVYVTLQRTAEQIAELLANQGYNARAYHAGMKTEERTEVQDAFMAASDMIVVATIAFGMGIDKANIRGVYHYNLPKSLENYMQEIGRAGRDGQPAVCELLACRDDLITLENFSYGDTPTEEAIRAMTRELLNGKDSLELSVYDLSSRHDVRELVVKTLLTYLELKGVLVPTGPVYTEFKFQPLTPSVDILKKFNAERAAFIKNLFRCAVKGKTWFTIDVVKVAEQIGEDRSRIVAALDYLDQSGDITLQTAGLKYGYKFASRPTDASELIEHLVERFARREEHDLARLHKVIDLAEGTGCYTRFLLEYFGENRGNCGHCSACHGAPRQILSGNVSATLTDSDRKAVKQLVAERHAALRAPRQLARFLCGIASPATTKAKLRSHREFGRLDNVPFAEVLALAETATGTR